MKRILTAALFLLFATSAFAADSKKLLDMIDEIDAAWKATGGAEKTRVAGRPG